MGALCQAGDMSDPVIIVLVSVALALIAALYAVMMWNSRQSARYLVRAVGIVLIIAGLLATGVTALVMQGLQAVVAWVQEKPMDTLTWVGIALAVVGVITTVVAGYLKAPTRAEAKQLRAERAANQKASAKAAAQAAAERQAQVPPPLPTASPESSGSTAPGSPVPSLPDAGTTPPDPPDLSAPDLGVPDPSAAGPTTGGPASTGGTPPGNADEEVVNLLKKHGIE